ncbi:SGS domain-containing protein [Biscogniauxia mediterranea]|nr:SGS domain-containing protein [Biscogniauxia mediterranea]
MPSASALAAEGVKAVAAGDYKQGISKLTEALKDHPAPLWLIERSKAYLRTQDFDHALHDAENALRVAFDRANRDQMIEAQIRRAITLFRMKRYADADICAFWALRLLDGAKASEDDGQMSKVDANGDYTPRASDLGADDKPSKTDQLSAAMSQSGGRSKESSLRNQAHSWRLQALAQLENLPAGDPGRKVNVSAKYPTFSQISLPKATDEDSTAMDIDEDSDNAADATHAASESSVRDAWEKVWKQYHVVHAKHDIRSSFYQTDTTVNVDFFVKNVSKDSLIVDSQPQRVKLSPIPNTYAGAIDLFLFGRIKPAETKYTVKSMKIELSLQKETPGKWPVLRSANAEVVDNIALGATPAASFNQFYHLITSLGYKHPSELQLTNFGKDQKGWYERLLEKLQAGVEGVATSSNDSHGVAKAVPVREKAAETTGSQDDSMQVDNPTPLAGQADPKKSSNGTPAYPTSSKKGPKNWDTIADDEEDEEKEEGDVNTFFQKLYKNADEDTRRAMMKSYVESNGTSLSTNWAEAKGKTYETLPPDGAEAKKWG